MEDSPVFSAKEESLHGIHGSLDMRAAESPCLLGPGRPPGTKKKGQTQSQVTFFFFNVFIYLAVQGLSWTFIVACGI